MPRPSEPGRTSRFYLLASIFLIITSLYFGREVLIPLALAILLSFVLTPVVRWVERLRLPRTPAVLMVVLIGVGFIAAIGYVVSRQFVSIIYQLPEYEDQLRSKFHALGGQGLLFRKAKQEMTAITAASTQAATNQPGARVVQGTPSRPSEARGLAPGATAASPTTQPTPDNPLPVRLFPSTGPLEVLRDFGSTVLSPLATAGLVLVFVIFMLITREDLRDRMIRIVGHGRLNLTTQALDEASTRISSYLSALAIVNTVYALVTASGLWVIGHFLGGRGFPNVLVWGILVGLFRFVPYVGIWIGASFPLLLSFALFPGNAVFFATLGLFIAMEIVVSQFVEPVWYGQTTGMSPLAVLVAAVFWTWLWGPIGLLLSTPLTVCLVVMGKYVPQLQFLDILLGDEPVLPPHLRVYQRLIAGDEEEAIELARQLQNDEPLEKLYDEVLIPALALAASDHHRGRLDDARLESIRQGMRHIVEEMGDEQKAREVRQAAAQTEQTAKDQPSATPPLKSRPALPKDCTVNVLCLPSKDEADEIVCLMLAQVLEMRGYCATAASVASLASEMVEMVEQTKAQIVCVSAMPPSAVAHARYLCKRLHPRYPDIDMVVGLWTAKGDLERAKDRIACAHGVFVVTSLDQAQHEIDQMARAHVVAQSGELPVGKKQVASSSATQAGI